MARGSGTNPDDEELVEREISDEERDEIVDDLVDDMEELFKSYVSGAVSFEDLTFEMYDTLRTLNALATGEVVIEYHDLEDEDEYDEFDELAGEPTGDSGSAPRNRSDEQTPSRPGHKPRGNG